MKGAMNDVACFGVRNNSFL